MVSYLTQEIGLPRNTYCCLTEIDTNIENATQEELNARAKAGAFIATLQAGYTDFHFLRPIWREQTEKYALIGVGMTGIGSGQIEHLSLEEAADVVNAENKRVASLIGINPAYNTTTVKPAGTSSLVLGCSSGVHAWFGKYYKRRMRLNKNEPIYAYLKATIPELMEDCVFKPETTAIVSMPVKAPEGAMLRTESPLDTLARVKKYNELWVRKGHQQGNFTNNVSCTISVKDGEWRDVGEWMWHNRESYNGISVLPYDGGTYPQLPFEDITEEEYNAMLELVKDIDMANVRETESLTNLAAESACAGGACMF